MGQHSGREHSGAAGKRQPMAHPHTIEQAAAALVAGQDREIERDDAREFAQGKRLDAVKKLNTLMRSRRSPPQVQRQAAKDLLEYGDQRPFGQPVGGGVASTGLNIVILNLTDGQVVKQEKTIDAAAQSRMALEQEIDVEPVEQRELDLEPAWQPESPATG